MCEEHKWAWNRLLIKRGFTIGAPLDGGVAQGSQGNNGKRSRIFWRARVSHGRMEAPFHSQERMKITYRITGESIVYKFRNILWQNLLPDPYVASRNFRKKPRSFSTQFKLNFRATFRPKSQINFSANTHLSSHRKKC